MWTSIWALGCHGDGSGSFERVSAASRSIWISSRPISHGEAVAGAMQTRRSPSSLPAWARRSVGGGWAAYCRLCPTKPGCGSRCGTCRRSKTVHWHKCIIFGFDCPISHYFANLVFLIPPLNSITSLRYQAKLGQYHVPQRKRILPWLTQTSLHFPSLFTARYYTGVVSFSIYTSEAKSFFPESIHLLTQDKHPCAICVSCRCLLTQKELKTRVAIQWEGANMSCQIIQVGFPHISTTADKDRLFFLIF